MSILIAKIHPASATPVVDGHIFPRSRFAPIGYAFGLNTTEDPVEILFTDLECIVMDVELVDIIITKSNVRVSLIRKGAKYPTFPSSNTSPKIFA